MSLRGTRVYTTRVVLDDDDVFRSYTLSKNHGIDNPEDFRTSNSIIDGFTSKNNAISFVNGLDEGGRVVCTWDGETAGEREKKTYIIYTPPTFFVGRPWKAKTSGKKKKRKNQENKEGKKILFPIGYTERGSRTLWTRIPTNISRARLRFTCT